MFIMPSPCFSFSSCSLSKLTFSHRHCSPGSQPGLFQGVHGNCCSLWRRTQLPEHQNQGSGLGSALGTPRWAGGPPRGLSPGSPGPASSHWKSVQGPPVLSGAGSAASGDEFITRAARFPVEQLAPEPPARRLSNCPGMASSGPSSQFS